MAIRHMLGWQTYCIVLIYASAIGLFYVLKSSQRVNFIPSFYAFWVFSSLNGITSEFFTGVIEGKDIF